MSLSKSLSLIIGVTVQYLNTLVFPESGRVLLILTSGTIQAIILLFIIWHLFDWKQLFLLDMKLLIAHRFPNRLKPETPFRHEAYL